MPHTNNEEFMNIDTMYSLKELVNSFDIVMESQTPLEERFTKLLMTKESLENQYQSMVQANLHILNKKSLGEIEHNSASSSQILSLRGVNFNEGALSVIFGLFM